MKLYHKKGLILFIMVLLLSLNACDNVDEVITESSSEDFFEDSENNSEWREESNMNLKSDTLYVKKVENIPDDFIMGMDASCVPALEKSGVKYYDFDKKEKDVYKILKENGINYIRVRIWNDPFDENGKGYGGGNCDIENAVAVGKRATENGMKLLVNFHYSDFWADPQKQMIPKAWVGMSIEEKSDAVYQYTKECLKKLLEAGVDVGMVQVGNETNGVLCGESSAEADGWKNITTLMSAGSLAVREVCPDALVAIHFSNPEKVSTYEEYSYNLDYYKVDYDVFASSYYSFWHGTLDNLAKTLSKISTKYNKKVMVAETSYAFTGDDTDFFNNTVSLESEIVKNYPYTVQGQANQLRDVIDTVVNKTVGGIGVFYWEGTWITVGGKTYEENLALWERDGSGWATSFAGGYDPKDAGQWHGGSSVDNQALFDKEGNALESLKIFNLVKTGNEVENRIDEIEDTNLVFTLGKDIVLPQTAIAVMLDNSKRAVPVVWETANLEEMKNGEAKKYVIKGEASGMKAQCHISMVEYNYVKNPDFEEGEAYWVATPLKSFEELSVEEKVSDSLSGTKHYHFWGSSENTVEFTLEQEIGVLDAGKFNYSVSIMGGDGGETEIYAYVKINGEIVYKAETVITAYDQWHTATISNMDYHGEKPLSVGIYVKCQGPNAWGKIDGMVLNRVS